ncbi:energy transducer TonB [Pontibacter sp. H259]|uniref:energy transducer TonB n=1 Tax=Pontibacter sp. H259 TaxID=3133421 RepID=UPI0030C1C96F
MKKNVIAVALLILSAACASHKKSPSIISDELQGEELTILEQAEPSMEIAIVEELPPPPEADQYMTSSAEQKAQAFADTTVFQGSQLETDPYLYHNGHNLAFYLEEQVNKVKAATGVKDKGDVTISVVVERDGSLTNPVIVASPSDVLTKHSLAILAKMPKWRPGSLNGWERRASATLYFYW